MKKIITAIIFSTLIPISASATTVTKDNWVASMVTAVPAYFCQENQYFRQCFNITQIECEKVALSATRVCLDNLNDKIPNVLNQPKDGSKWGAEVGECTGGAYDVILQEKKISSDLCNDVNNWN